MLYVLIAVVVLVIFYFIVTYYVAGTAIHLNRQPVPRTPKDYGMDFEAIEFKASDGVNIKGWLIPGSQEKLIVMTHVGGLTKYGSTISYKNLTKLYNKEVEFLRTAKNLYEAGYWVLMFDFRNHGESGPDPDRGIAGVGLKEYKDVVAAMNFIQGREQLKDMSVGFVSFCMGANSTIIAMSKEPGAFNNVKCLLAIQPISYEVFIRTYTKKLFTQAGSWLLLSMIKKFMLLRGSYPIGEMSPSAYVKDLKVPTKYVQATNDPWTELSDIRGFYENTPDNPREIFWIADTKHRFESYTYFQDRPQQMMDWVKRWL